MTAVTIGDERLLKAAKLFAHKDMFRPALERPWLQRVRGKNLIIATNGHYMFVATDQAGRNYPRHPTHWPISAQHDFPKWPAAIPLAAPRRADHPVWVNPKYLERIARAAKICEVDSMSISSSHPHDCIAFKLGDHVFVGLMPMRQPEGPAVPAWLREAIVTIPPKKQKAKPQKKRRRR
jgi:hypothetical protein